MPTSSPNMPGILHRSQSPSGIRTYGMYQIPPLSFLHTSNLSDWSLSRKEIDGSAFIEELGKLILRQCCAWQQNSINYASIQDLTSWSGQSPLLISSDGLLVTKNWQAVWGPVPLWTRWRYISRLHLMKCSPLVTLLLLPSRDSSCHRWHC
jgi:hypothetical protein